MISKLLGAAATGQMAVQQNIFNNIIEQNYLDKYHQNEMLSQLQITGLKVIKDVLTQLQSQENFLEEDPDIYHDIKQIVEENGYKFEEHTVTTADGYILTLHRIQLEEGGKPVLLQHGIEDSSDCWVMNSPDKAPAFLLAKDGFDVWLANSRGNKFSKKHTSLSPSQYDYWQFTWEEMGIYDQPANINYILEVTGAQKLAAYIGHSQGTTQFFAGGSLIPDFFHNKVSLFVALAPVVRLDLGENFLLKLGGELESTVVGLANLIKFYDMIEYPEIILEIMGSFCTSFVDLCVLMQSGYTVMKEGLENTSRYGVKYAHSPAGNGYLSIAHFGQLLRDKKFQRYDYGSVKENMAKYNQTKPPKYDLSKFNVKTMIAHGDLDTLANQVNIEWLLDEKQSGLRTNELLVFNKMYHFQHIGFWMSQDMTYFTQDILPVIHQYSSIY